MGSRRVSSLSKTVTWQLPAGRCWGEACYLHFRAVEKVRQDLVVEDQKLDVISIGLETTAMFVVVCEEWI